MSYDDESVSDSGEINLCKDESEESQKDNDESDTDKLSAPNNQNGFKDLNDMPRKFKRREVSINEVDFIRTSLHF